MFTTTNYIYIDHYLNQVYTINNFTDATTELYGDRDESLKRMSN